MIDSKSNHINEIGQDITIIRTPISYTGKAIIGKIKGSNTDFSLENKRFINALLGSSLITGEIVTCGTEKYLVVASKAQIVEGQEIAIIANALICNTTLTVTREVLSYDLDGNVIGSTTTTIINAADCFAEAISSQMRQIDPGLLPNTVLRLYAVNNNGLALLDKATVFGGSYQVNFIDRFKIPGAMVVQLSTLAGG